MSNVMNEGQMWDEIERLHVELAKANGACAEMACELASALQELERAEDQRNTMQAHLERAEHRADSYCAELARRAALMNERRGVLIFVEDMLDRLHPEYPLEAAHRVVAEVRKAVRAHLGAAPKEGDQPPK